MTFEREVDPFYDLGYTRPEDVSRLHRERDAHRAATRKPKHFMPRRSRSVVGPVPGESEGEITPAGHEEFVELNDQERAVGRAGVAAAREALDRTEPQS